MVFFLYYVGEKLVLEFHKIGKSDRCCLGDNGLLKEPR